jgi:hypothetical protein
MAQAAVKFFAREAGCLGAADVQFAHSGNAAEGLYPAEGAFVEQADAGSENVSGARLEQKRALCFRRTNVDLNACQGDPAVLPRREFEGSLD